MLKSLQSIEEPKFQKVSLFLLSINKQTLKPQILFRLHQDRELYQTFGGQLSDDEPSIFFTAARCLVKQSFGLLNPKRLANLSDYKKLVDYYHNDHEFSTQSADSTTHLMSSQTFHQTLIDIMESFCNSTAIKYFIHQNHLTLFYLLPELIPTDPINQFLHFNCKKTELEPWSFHWLPLPQIINQPMKEMISGFDRVLLEEAEAKFNLSDPDSVLFNQQAVNGKESGDRYAVFACQNEPSLKSTYQALYIGNLLQENQIWESYQLPNLQFPDNDKVSKLKGIVISGSKHASYDQDQSWIGQLKLWLQQAYQNFPHLKIVGICFGHQITARALGGESSKMSLPVEFPLIIKKEKIYLTQDFCSLDYVKRVAQKIAPGHNIERVTLLQIHGDAVQELPQGFSLYGTSKSCKIEAYGYKNRVLCFQAHPQFNQFYMYQKLLLARRMKGSLSEDQFSIAAKNILGEQDDHQNNKLDRFLTFKIINEFLKSKQ